jgi:hypothetical protein
VQSVALVPNFIQVQSSQEEILLNSKPWKFSDFSFEMYFKSKEVPVEKVVHLFDIFTTIFFFQIFRAWES